MQRYDLSESRRRETTKRSASKRISARNAHFSADQVDTVHDLEAFEATKTVVGTLETVRATYFHHPSYGVLVLVKAALLLAGLSMSMWQTSKLLDTYIHQTTVSEISIQLNTSLKRPTVVVCANILQIYLSGAYKDLGHDDIRRVAALGEDYGPLLTRHLSDIVKIHGTDYPYVSWENELFKIALNFTDCSDMLGICNDLIQKSSPNGPHSCCEDASQWYSSDSVCYSITTASDQFALGKPNTAMFKLVYPVSKYDVVYDVYLKAERSMIATTRQQIASVKPETEVSVAVRRTESRHLNTTSRKCTSLGWMVGDNCKIVFKQSAARALCHCESSLPIWTFNVSSLTDNGFDPNTPRSNDSLRPCRFLETWICQANKSWRSQYDIWMKTNQWSCFDVMCDHISFGETTTIVPLAPYFADYTDHRKNGSVRSSMLYVFYDTMTIVKHSEVYPYDWLTALSNVGGIWGLWLGWSLYQVANVLITFLQKRFNR